MRILIFHYDVLDEFGGVEAVVCNLARELNARGHSVGVIEMGIERTAPRELYPGIPIWRLLAMQLPRWSSPRSWASFLRTYLQLHRVVASFSPDVIHVHYPARQAALLAVASRLPRRWGLAVTLHNSDIWGRPADYEALKPWRRHFFQNADEVTAVCRSLLESACQDYPCITGKGRVIYNGISRDWLTMSLGDLSTEINGTRYVLYAGRLSEVKGIDILLSAWSRVCNDFPDVQLLIVGDGPMDNILRQQAHESGLMSSVRFLPAKGKDELAVLYRHAECLVLPSRREGQGLVLVEAGILGTICIASDVVGVNEVIEDGRNGILVPYGDDEALAASIARVLDMGLGERRRIGEEARRNVHEHFIESHMIDEYIRLYQDIRKSREK